ncbi:MAG: hypothetical protein M1548_09250 [Actinobacteria bacterium]|nr:hypothetical protein [Actinomycetota bacterium]
MGKATTDNAIDRPVDRPSEATTVADIPSEVMKAAEESTLRHDAVTFLDYVGAHTPELAEDKGLKTKDVWAVNDLFAECEEIQVEIEGEAVTLSTEDEVCRVGFIRRLLQSAGFLKIRHGRLSPTRRATEFLKDDYFSQLRWLFNIWWYEVDWTLDAGDASASTNIFQGDRKKLADILLSLPTGMGVAYRELEKTLLKEFGLSFLIGKTGADLQSYMNISYGVVQPLEIFEAITMDVTGDFETLQDLKLTLSITELGKTLLSRV